MEEHLKELQAQFFKEKKGRSKAPYSNNLTQAQVDEILQRTLKQTDRYRLMKKAGASEAEIKKAFDTPEEMSVFSWTGEKDTLMTPMDSIKYYKHFLRAGFMSMNPFNGHVKAYVGGPNYTYFQYDMAMVGRRQVGSTIKPYLYAYAMENGFSPCDETRHVEQTLLDENGIPWTPRNSTKKRYGELVTLKWGLANSSNWVSAYLMSKLNPYAMVRLIHSFGVRNKEIMPTVSLALGPCEISVGEMVSAYTAFANKGIRVAPLFVTRIEDSEGNVLATFSPQMEEVISASSAYKMLVMLRAVINEGTGGRVRSRYGITADMGGKTGTTNSNSDGWFMGFIPSLVSGCWVGGEERDIHFDTMTYGQGASLALPIWAKYMNKVFADPTLGYDPTEEFQLPEGFDPCAGSEVGYDDSGDTGLDDLLIDSALSACLICIGSNDHRKENLLLARQNLYALFPSIYFATEMETEPLYLKNTARFSNQVALFVTAMEKDAVVNALKEIEMKAGRRPEDKTAEKIPLDIDLLVYGNEILKPKDLRREYIQKGVEELGTLLAREEVGEWPVE